MRLKDHVRSVLIESSPEFRTWECEHDGKDFYLTLVSGHLLKSGYVKLLQVIDLLAYSILEPGF